MRNFIRTLPRELIEAARVEGVAEWRIFWFIVISLVGCNRCTFCADLYLIWNDYFWAIVLTQGIEQRP